MDRYRLRFIHTDGRISVRDQAFSQVTQTLQGLSQAAKDGFWKKHETALPDGSSVVFVREV